MAARAKFNGWTGSPARCPAIRTRTGRAIGLHAVQSGALHLLPVRDGETQSPRDINPKDFLIAQALHNSKMSDTRLGEIARKLVPLLDEFQVEANRVMDENGRRDAIMLKDYMLRKYPRVVVFLACADTLAELAQNAPT